MDMDWKRLERDVQALTLSITELRAKLGGLHARDIERLLAPLRACMVELIALRSSLEKAKNGPSTGNAEE